jgi:di/tricarboxylate transporter
MSWLDYVPASKRPRLLVSIRLRRIFARLRSRVGILAICFACYLLWCLYLVLNGRWFELVLAIVSSASVLVLTYIAYWLAWKEFHE